MSVEGEKGMGYREETMQRRLEQEYMISWMVFVRMEDRKNGSMGDVTLMPVAEQFVWRKHPK